MWVADAVRPRWRQWPGCWRCCTLLRMVLAVSGAALAALLHAAVFCVCAFTSSISNSMT